MSREPRWARDGPSRRAPGRRLRRTHFSAARRASVASNDDGVREVWRSQTRMQGQAFWFLFTGLAFQRLEKGLAGGRNQKHQQSSVISFAKPSSTT
ncbi:hypothetical protein DMX10_27725 [Pseudomonas sp. 57B-090624]|nr:hypothetical protein DMX10_27725 [Pseudomonas sp. 57B-090624]